METEELINVCQAVTHGNLRQVRNLKTGKLGGVINVEGEELTVHVGKGTEVWTYRECEEVYRP
jgi:hypothetical protein